MRKTEQFIETTIEILEDEIQTMKDDVKWFAESMGTEISCGHYDQASQWAGKIQAMGAKIDAQQKQLSKIKSIL